MDGYFKPPLSGTKFGKDRPAIDRMSFVMLLLLIR